MIGGSDLVAAMRARRAQMRPKDGSDDQYVVKTTVKNHDTRGEEYVKRRISELEKKISDLNNLDAALVNLDSEKATQETIVRTNTSRAFGMTQKATSAQNQLISINSNIARVKKEIAARDVKIAEHTADIEELRTLDTKQKITTFLESKIKAHPDSLLQDKKTTDSGFFRYDIQTAKIVLRDMRDAAVAAAAIPPSIVDIHPIALLADAIERATAQGVALPSLDQSLSASICASMSASSIQTTTNVDLSASIYSSKDQDYAGLFAAVQATKAPASSSSSSSSSSTTDLSESKLNARNLLIKVLDSNEGKVREFFTTLLKANNSALIVNLMTNLEAGEIEQAYVNAKALIGMGMPEGEFANNLKELGIYLNGILSKNMPKLKGKLMNKD